MTNKWNRAYIFFLGTIPHLNRQNTFSVFKIHFVQQDFFLLKIKIWGMQAKFLQKYIYISLGSKPARSESHKVKLSACSYAWASNSATLSAHKIVNCVCCKQSCWVLLLSPITRSHVHHICGHWEILMKDLPCSSQNEII